MIVKSRADFYEERHPVPEDVLLLIEVSDRTIGYDRRVKLPLYALHRVPEVWIVDLDRGIIRVHRDPTPDGYRVVRTRRRGDRLGPAAFPDIVVRRRRYPRLTRDPAGPQGSSWFFSATNRATSAADVAALTSIRRPKGS